LTQVTFDLCYVPNMKSKRVNKMKGTIYQTVGTVPKYNRKVIERGKIDIINTHIHDRSHP